MLLVAAARAGGLALLLFSGALIFSHGAYVSPPSNATVARMDLLQQSLGAVSKGDPHLPPDASVGDDSGAPDAGAALALVDAGALYRGLAGLAASAPTATAARARESLSGTPAALPHQIEERPDSMRSDTEASGGPEPPPASQNCPSVALSGPALALFDAITGERSARGLPALAAHGCAAHLAQIRADDMAGRGYFSHASPEGETAFSLLDRHGVPYGFAGENIARNTYPAGETVAAAIRTLMESDPHRAYILNGDFTSLGVGAALSPSGASYFSMIFIRQP